MKRIVRISALIYATALAVGFASIASADSDTFDVTATVEGSCSVTAGNALEFGNYNPVDGSEVDGSTTISVTCSNGLSDTEVGLAYSGNMTFDTNELSYALFQDSGRSTPWGDTEEQDRQSVTADGTAQELTVYGRIDADQSTVPVGSYSETVTATVYW